MPIEDAYWNAVRILRETHGNHKVLEEIQKTPNQTKFILQESLAKSFLVSIPYIIAGISLIIYGCFGFTDIPYKEQTLLIPVGVSILLFIHLRTRKTYNVLNAAFQVAYDYGKL